MTTTSLRILPLRVKAGDVESTRGILYENENTIAFLEIEQQNDGDMRVWQTYRGVVDGEFVVMGESVFPR
jgi:hypothetical protein